MNYSPTMNKVAYFYHTIRLAIESALALLMKRSQKRAIWRGCSLWCDRPLQRLGTELVASWMPLCNQHQPPIKAVSTSICCCFFAIAVHNVLRAAQHKVANGPHSLHLGCNIPDAEVRCRDSARRAKCFCAKINYW